IKGNIATGVRATPGWAQIANLRMDPFERGMEEGGGPIDFLARQLWVSVPAINKVKSFFADFESFPHQDCSALNAPSINYHFLKEAKAMKTLKSMERVGTPG